MGLGKYLSYYSSDSSDGYIGSFRLDTVDYLPEISLPPVNEFKLTTILSTQVEYEVTELISSLREVSKSHRVDLSNLINRILAYQKDHIFAELESLDSKFQVDYKRLKLVNGKVKRNNKLVGEMAEVEDLTGKVTDVVSRLVRDLKVVEEKVLTYKKERLLHEESVNKDRYPLLSKLMRQKGDIGGINGVGDQDLISRFQESLMGSSSSVETIQLGQKELEPDEEMDGEMDEEMDEAGEEMNDFSQEKEMSDFSQEKEMNDLSQEKASELEPSKQGSLHDIQETELNEMADFKPKNTIKKLSSTTKPLSTVQTSIDNIYSEINPFLNQPDLPLTHLTHHTPPMSPLSPLSPQEEIEQLLDVRIFQKQQFSKTNSRSNSQQSSPRPAFKPTLLSKGLSPVPPRLALSDLSTETVLVKPIKTPEPNVLLTSIQQKDTKRKQSLGNWVLPYEMNPKAATTTLLTDTDATGTSL